MSRSLRTAALIVGAVALVATGVGAAAGAGLLGAAAAGSAGIVAGVSVATIATVGTLASVAAGVIGLAGALTAKKPSSSVTGSPTQFSADPQAFIPYVIGRTGTAGNIVFRRGFDTTDKGDNDRQSFVAILSGAGPIKGFQRLEVDRATVTFGANGAALGGYAGYMWQGQQVGVPAGPAIGFGTGAGAPPGWTAQHKLSGYASTSWTLRYDTKGKLYANGVPAPLWLAEGVMAYDPRYDSTYPGGNGPQRIGDEATWAYSENPYIHGLTWVIGRRQNGIRILGIGAPVAGIDVAAYVEGANVADANGWKVGGVVYSGDGKWDVLKRILQAGMGEPMALGARISCFVNAPKVSLATIGASDVVGDASVTATQPRRDRLNTITPRYRLEANNWQLLPGAPITVAEHVAEDGGRRSRELDYLLIQATDQVATAVRYDIENAREFGPIVLPLKPVWVGFKPGDCITANLPELGLNGQALLLLGRDLDPSTGVVTLTSRSETAAKHPFALGQTTTPPPTPGITGPLLVPVPADGAWAITGTEIVRGETKVPAIVIAGATDSPVAETVVFEYRVVVAGQGADAGWQGAGEEPPTVTGKAITGIRPGAAYEAAISYRRRGIVGDRLVLGPVQVGVLAIDFDYVTGPNRPSPNATDGADPESPLGPNKTVGEVLANIEAIRTDIETLYDEIGAGSGGGGTIGDAVAAAKEAQRLAELAQQLAEDAQAAAGLQADEAARQAGFGKGYSDTAKSYQDEAGRKVEAAQAQVRLAETEVGKAQGFVRAAQLVKEEVDGVKVQAVDAAGVAVQAKSDAQLAVSAAFPRDMFDARNFTADFDQPPPLARPLTVDSAQDSYSDANIDQTGRGARVFRYSRTVGARNWLAVVPGRRYRVSTTVTLHDRGTGPLSRGIYGNGLLCFDAAGAFLGAKFGVGIDPWGGGQFQSARTELTTEEIRATNTLGHTFYVRPFVQVIVGDGGLWSGEALAIDDVTSEVGAAGSASASAESNRLAGVAKDAAGVSAGAAQDDRIKAETARTGAEGASGTATTAKENAQRSEAKAASYERLSATASENATYLDTYKVWTFAGVTEGWYVDQANYALLSGANGLLFNANAGSDDGKLQIDNLLFAGSRYDRVIVDVTRRTARTNGYFEGRIYYANPKHYWDGNFFSACAQREVLIGERTQLTFDMRNLSQGGRDWIDNPVSSLRLDLDAGQNAEWLIHSIRVVGSDSLAPAKSAYAASESARVASASEDKAGRSASAAEQSVQAAGGQAGEARTARDQAAGYRDQADGSARAAATTATDIKARIYSKNNLLPYGSGENGINKGGHTWRGGGGNWYSGTQPTWGPRMQCDNTTATTISLDSPIISCDANQHYTCSADMLFFSDAPDLSCYVDLIFLRADGSVTRDGGERLAMGQRDFGSPNFREMTWATAQAPSDAVQMFMRGVWQASSGTHRNIGLREGKIEQGAGPYTAYSQEATLSLQGGVIADTAGKQRAYYQVTGAVPGARATMALVVQNDNGQLTSDIVLDASNLYLNGNVWINNQLATGGIADFAVNGLSSASAPSALVDRYARNIHVITIVSTGKPILISVGGQADNGPTEVYLGVYRSGSSTQVMANRASQGRSMTMVQKLDLPAGTHTFRLEGSAVQSAGQTGPGQTAPSPDAEPQGTTAYVIYPALIVQEVKK